ncbi:phage antirepressor KilAC domain-containing protein [Streptomyces goshikiensis]|uniref:phage antirepressor KilAC domain-containing protein n=1 Tax=Streptomyces goshikiensis TaxID=1942 RepID=UPI0036A46F02
MRRDGTEFWSARALMHVMGYSRWENFHRPLDRAMSTARNTGLDVARNFLGSQKVSGDRGPLGEDVELSRHAAYLVAMNGDPNKPEVAAAQAYFAVRTREAELWAAEVIPVLEAVRPAPDANAVVLPRTYEEALAALLDSVRGRRVAEERVAELAPAARSWELLAAQDRRGDFTLGEAAQMLCRAGLDTGQNRLLEDMRRWGWVRANGRPYQRTVDRGWMAARPRAYAHRDTGEPILGAQTRVTAAGVNAAHDLLVRERQVPLPRFPGRGGPRPLAGNPDLGDGQGDAADGVQW